VGDLPNIAGPAVKLGFGLTSVKLLQVVMSAHQELPEQFDRSGKSPAN
jgi:hypothetical protein